MGVDGGDVSGGVGYVDVGGHGGGGGGWDVGGGIGSPFTPIFS